MSDTYDLVIVGGGVLGTFSAYHALRLGKKVALIERNKQPISATVRNFGQIVPSGLSSSWRHYGLKSLDIYKELQQFFDFTVRQNGSVYIASTEDEITLLQELQDITNRDGYPAQVLSTQDMTTRWPGMKPTYARQGLFFTDEVSVDPEWMIHYVLRYLTEQFELDYHPYTIAQHIETKGSSVCEIRTNTGLTLKTDQVLICTGAEYQLLFPDEYKSDEISCVKIHMLMTRPQPRQRLPGNILTGLSIRRYEAFQDCPSWTMIKAKNQDDPRIMDWGIHILFKQADNGQIIIGDSHQYADAHDQDHLGFQLDHDITSYIMELAGEIFTLEDSRVAASWYGVYAQAKYDDLIQKTIEGRIHILNAIGGKGMTAGPGYTYHYINSLFSHD